MLSSVILDRSGPDAGIGKVVRTVFCLADVPSAVAQHAVRCGWT